MVIGNVLGNKSLVSITYALIQEKEVFEGR